jgi:tripartite-type tricarboxylate transporter receptor subunit TctC
MKSRYLAMLAVVALVLAACGDDGTDADASPDDASTDGAEEEPDDDATDEDEADEEPADEPEAAGLDCNNIEFMVPYAPGGGSDQQVRRLEPALSEYLDTNINIVYREGANGAVAWLALKESAPDGCTVANVVYPNIVLASMEDDEQTFTADEFTHLGQTETAPQTVAVPHESEFETIEQFIEEALENPGAITVGGTGLNGEVTAGQISDATGIDVSYVPMEGGVGDTIPLLLGGHVDAAMFSSSHIEANSDTIRALAIAGDVRSDSENLADIPTFHELGYEGVDFATSWGVLGPPGMPDDIAQIWNDAIHYATDNDDMRTTLVEGGLTPLYHSLDESAAWNLTVQQPFGIR